MEVKPFEESTDTRKEQVKEMFNKIAGDYDFLNHFLSFNTDKAWRRKLLKMMQSERSLFSDDITEINILDVATGTGDLAFALSKVRNSKITGLDLSAKMLDVAKQKAARINSDIRWIEGDSEELPFENNSFHFVTVAFGVRNYENLQLGLKEMIRVLKPGGKLYILEFSKPKKGLFSWSYGLYSKKILPSLASIFTKEPRAYTYLPDSIQAFPSGEEMIKELESASLKNTSSRRLTGGIATIYHGEK